MNRIGYLQRISAVRSFWFGSLMTTSLAMLGVSVEPQWLRADDEPKPAAEKPAAEKPAAEKPAAEKPSAEKPAAEKPAAQKPAAEKPAAEKPAPVEGEQAIKEYQAKLAEWKGVLKDLRAIKVKFQTAPDAEAAELRKSWDESVKKGDALIPQLRTLGTAAYVAQPNVDLALARFLVNMLEDDVRQDRYEDASVLAQTLLDNQCELAELYQFAGVVAFSLNQFDKADELFKKAADANALTNELAKKFQVSVDEYKKLWEVEEKLRQAESQKDDLPRVKIKTSKGDMVIELFENEAPETVGNFINLVESKFYNGLSFHRVLGNFMAQGGCPIGTGTGDPGYKIYCEWPKDNRRSHFRGTLSMAHAGKDTGGSQFFLTFVPTSHLNGRHTVFGRVVEGLDVLAKIQRINPEDPSRTPPDKMLEVTVLRKRDHEYVPNKVK